MSRPKDRPIKFTVYLDVETHKALRHRAIEEGEPATKIVERLVASYVSTKSARKGGAR